MNMKKFIYLVFIAMMSCATTDTTFVIDGNISGLESNLLYSKIVNGTPKTIDTIKVVDGKFKFTAQNLKEHDFRFLIPESNQLKFIKIFIDNSDISIQGNIDTLDKAKVTGSVNHTLFSNLMKEYEDINTETQLLILEIQMAKNDEDGVSVTNLEDKLYTNEDKKPALFINFAKSNPDSNVSAWALLQIVPFAEYNQLESAYEVLSDKVKSSYYSRTLKMILDEMGKTAVGAKAPGFSLPNLKGESVNLSDIKSKVVLVDFWSPMCSHCRIENPHLVDLYNKYKSKGLEIVGINVDGTVDLDIWELVIKEDKLDWTQLRDTVGIADVYKVQRTPFNVLVDSTGVIIAKDLHEKELEDKLKDLFK